jgi:hypothetical protein
MFRSSVISTLFFPFGLGCDRIEPRVVERDEEMTPVRSGVHEGSVERRRRSFAESGLGWCGGLVAVEMRQRRVDTTRIGRGTAVAMEEKLVKPYRVFRARLTCLGSRRNEKWVFWAQLRAHFDPLNWAELNRVQEVDLFDSP